ncbi:MAG: hypothetical protein ACH350_02955 [Parachlamydiaceae bacterium]
MDFHTLSSIFNRSLRLTFSKKKLLSVFCVLALSGLLVVFFRGLSLHAGQWVKLSLTFLPIFICTGILLSMGILLIRIYHDEVKGKEVNYLKTFSRSWKVAMAASYFAIPIIFAYLLLWMVLGIFVLLSEIPAVGEFFAAILAFGPFLINLSSLVLCLLSLGMLFFISPLIAFRGLEGGLVSHIIIKRLEKDGFANFILILMALLPLVLVVTLLILAAAMTGSLCFDCHHSLQTVIKWFFIMLPFTACLTPAVIFFFNFSAEAHVLMQKQIKEG